MSGKMVESMLGSTKRIKNMAKAHTTILMEVKLKGLGMKENKLVRVSISIKTGTLKLWIFLKASIDVQKL